LPSAESKYKIYSYAPQLTINIPSSPDKEIDLTDYLHNNKTVFKWYRQENLTMQLTDIVEKNEKGKFHIPSVYANTDLLCNITNSDFPDFTGENAMKCKVHVGSNSNVAIIVEQNKEIQPDKNKASIDINIEIPSNATAVNAEIKLNVPNQIDLDRNSLEEYMEKGNYVFNKIEKTTTAFSSNWFLSAFYDWLPYNAHSTRASTESVTLLSIPFTIDESLSDGNYTITISSIKLDFDNVIRYIETDIPVIIKIDRSLTGIKRSNESDIIVNYNKNGIYIKSPFYETVDIYSIDGTLLFNVTKTSSEILIPVNYGKEKIFIVKGGNGWVRKVVGG